MTLPTAVPKNARKSAAYIQAGSVFKHRFTLPSSVPSGTNTTRMEFRSALDGSLITSVTGTVSGTDVSYSVAYTSVSSVPNGSTFYLYVHLSSDASGVEHMVEYGTVFLRQLVFPHSPSVTGSTLTKTFVDDFQRPAGPVGSRWKILAGRPVIYENTSWLGDKPNTVGPDWAFYSRYFMRYYEPFNDDSITLNISTADKGDGTTVVAVCCAGDASSYIYAGFQSTGSTNKVEIGIGSNPDIGAINAPSNLSRKSTQETVSINDAALTGFRIKYNATTKKVQVLNAAGTVEYVAWTDTASIVPHGKGYRYFGIGGRAGAFNAGVQVAYISASDVV